VDLTNIPVVIGGEGYIIDSSPNPSGRFYRLVSF
jgi:hypothetical protein